MSSSSLHAAGGSSTPSTGAVIAIELRPTGCRGALVELDEAIRAEDHRESDVGSEPTAALLACLRRLRDAAVALDATVRAVAVGMCGGLAVPEEVLAEHVSEPLLVQHETSLASVIEAGVRIGRSRPRVATPGAVASTPSLPAGVRERILRAVDPDHSLALLRTLIRTPSVTGHERFLAGVVAGELHALGFNRVAVDEIAPGRANAWGLLRGCGDRGALLLAGHLDTPSAEGWASRWRNDERADPFGAAVVDGQVWGRGAVGGKSGIAAALAALWVLSRAGLMPRGSLMLAGLADREAGNPGLGTSAGMRALAGQLQVADLPRPDFAVYFEPTRLAIWTAQVGLLVAELAVPAGAGDHAIFHALEAHAATLVQSVAHPLIATPSLAVSRVDGRVRVVRLLVPGERLEDAATALEVAVASALGQDRIEVAYAGGRDHPLGGRPFEVSPAEPGAARLRAAIRSVRPDRGQVQGAPVWSELSFLTEMGIPGAYFSAGDIADRYGVEEHVDIADFLDAVRALALFIAEQCGVLDVPPSDEHADAR